MAHLMQKLHPAASNWGSLLEQGIRASHRSLGFHENGGAKDESIDAWVNRHERARAGAAHRWRVEQPGRPVSGLQSRLLGRRLPPVRRSWRRRGLSGLLRRRLRLRLWLSGIRVCGPGLLRRLLPRLLRRLSRRLGRLGLRSWLLRRSLRPLWWSLAPLSRSQRLIEHCSAGCPKLQRAENQIKRGHRMRWPLFLFPLVPVSRKKNCSSLTRGTKCSIICTLILAGEMANAPLHSRRTLGHAAALGAR